MIRERLIAEPCDDLLSDAVDIARHLDIVDQRQLRTRRQSETLAELLLVGGGGGVPGTCPGQRHEAYDDGRLHAFGKRALEIGNMLLLSQVFAMARHSDPTGSGRTGPTVRGPASLGHLRMGTC